MKRTAGVLAAGTLLLASAIGVTQLYNKPNKPCRGANCIPTATVTVRPSVTSVVNTSTPTKTKTFTPTATPFPPTATATQPSGTLPPALPTPPAGVPHAAYISITPRNFVSAWPDELYREIDCGIAKSISYYLAKQTGYTIWFDCYHITTQGDAIDLGSEPPIRSGYWLDGFAGVYVSGTGCDITGTIPCDLGFKPALVPDPDGPSFNGSQGECISGCLRGGQGLNRNAIVKEVEAQLGSVLQHNRDGSPAGIRIHSVRNGGGYAGGGTYCLTALGAQIDCAQSAAIGNTGFAHIGDWQTNYYAGVVMIEGRPRPLSFNDPLTPSVISAMDWGCWDKYADDSGRAGACDDDPRSVSFHEALHGLCVDSHFPVYLGSPLINMHPEQITKFISCMQRWIYPVSQEFRDSLR